MTAVPSFFYLFSVILDSIKYESGVFMKKLYMLDTNVLMRNPNALFKFEDNDVCICYATLQELDNNKTKGGETGFCAREAVRTIYALQEGYEEINKIPLGKDKGVFSIENDYYNQYDDSTDYLPCSADDIIISTAKHLGAILVTSDISMLLKAKALNCKTEVFKNEQASDATIEYLGRKTILVPSEKINTLYSIGAVDLDAETYDIHENEYITLKDEAGSSQSGIGRFSCGKLFKISDNLRPKNISPRNHGQKCAIDALLAPVDEVPLVILKGPAGTAKTFLALAAGLDLIEKKQFNRMLILRPNIKFDEDIGYLKGDEMEKITPLIRPCLDNLETLLTPTIEATEYARAAVNKLFADHTIEAEALAYIRGRSIANTYILVDEAQNSTPNQILGIISRAGVNSKIVITGDPDQIDNPKLDKKNNGLVYAAEKMLGSSLCAQVGFSRKECVRSPLAAESAKRLAL